MPSLARRLWLDAQPDALAALHHPFIRALSNGLLSRLVLARAAHKVCYTLLCMCSATALSSKDCFPLYRPVSF